MPALSGLYENTFSTPGELYLHSCEHKKLPLQLPLRKQSSLVKTDVVLPQVSQHLFRKLHDSACERRRGSLCKKWS